MLKYALALLLSCSLATPVWAEATAVPSTAPAKMSLAQTVQKLQIVDGVSMDDAIESMKLRANTLNMKLVAHLPLYKELEAQGVEDVRRIEIFQFCDAQIAKQMVDSDMSFAAYLPCRITLLEDKQGQAWLVMLNMDMVMGMVDLSPELNALAEKVRDNMNSILEAGANGDL